MTDTVDDRQALRLIERSNPLGLEAIYDRYSPVMLRVALRLLKNRRDAEDLLHDVFLEVWHKAGQFDESRGNLRNWLLLRIRSRALDRIRAANVARRYAAANSAWADSVLLVPDQSATTADGSLARKALGALSNKQRDVVELGYFQGLTCNEIARRCQIPVGTVKSRMSAGIRALRRELSPLAETTS